LIKLLKCLNGQLAYAQDTDVDRRADAVLLSHVVIGGSANATKAMEIENVRANMLYSVAQMLT